MDNRQFFDLCARRLSGSLSEKEEVAWKAYLTQHPEEEKIYLLMQRQWQVSGQLRLKYQVDPQLAWEKFNKMKPSHRPKVVHWSSFAMRLAAMVVLTIGLGWLFHEFGKTEPYYYATAEGETKWVTLPDSSRIQLNGSSLLTVEADFNESDRRVAIKGEAYFEINRDEQKPFLIQSEGVTTKVLGTTFNINARESLPDVSIYVVSGKVAFYDAQSELILTKGMGARFDKENQKLQRDQMSDNATAWHSHVLKFEDAPLQSVFQDLETYFNVDIFVNNYKIESCRFTGEFTQPGIEEILQIIAISVDIKYAAKAQGYFVEGKGCEVAN